MKPTKLEIAVLITLSMLLSLVHSMTGPEAAQYISPKSIWIMKCFSGPLAQGALILKACLMGREGLPYPPPPTQLPPPVNPPLATPPPSDKV